MQLKQKSRRWNLGQEVVPIRFGWWKTIWTQTIKISGFGSD
jgi:hypothetical protein